jgi:putative NIF3 family GTP cyclohydrolase 1 type 2
MELKDFAIFVKERLGANFVKLWPAASRVDLKVSRIGVCGGNGSSLIDVVSPYVDVFVSSDFTYHKILESRIPLIDAGHFHTEFPIMKTLQEKIEKLSIEVEVYDPKLAEINKLIII